MASNNESSGKIYFRYNLKTPTREEKQISHSIYFLFIINIYMKPSESEQNKEELRCEAREGKFFVNERRTCCVS